MLYYEHIDNQVNKIPIYIFRKELEEFAIKSQQEKELKKELEEKVSKFDTKMP